MDLIIQMQAFAYQTITAGGAAVGFAAANISSAGVAPTKVAVITVETASCRFRIDGVDPTAAVGHLLDVGDSVVLWGNNNLRAFRAIATGVNATLRVTYLR